MLLLLSSAFALTVPVRATFTEDVAPGDSSAASTARTATVALSNPDTGDVFTVGGAELTVNGREATGGTALSFATSPAGSLRTWAVYFVGADGAVRGDPEVVDVLFDALGNGAIAARDGGGWLASLTVSAAGTARIAVTGAGAEAAYVGLVELTSDGGRLLTDPDLSVLDATAYAAFQGLGLDAMVALESWRVQLDGTLQVTGLAVAEDGTVESGHELLWDLAFHDGRTVTDCPKGGTCTTTPVTTGTASYASAIGAVKRRRATETPRVHLKPSDQTFDSWDAGFSFTIAGDARDLELAASIDILEARVASDVVALDPNGLGVTSRDDDDDDTGMIVDIFIDVDCGCCPSDAHLPACQDDEYTAPGGGAPVWFPLLYGEFEVTVLDSAGRAVGTHECLVYPTAATAAGTAERALLVGECTRDTGGTEVRRLLAEVGPRGASVWTVELAGPAFTRTSTETTCEKGGICSTATTSVLGGTVEIAVDGEAFLSRQLSVDATTFELPFALASDADGLDAALTLELLDPERALTWTEADGVLYGKDGDTVVHAIAVEDLEVAATGLYSTPRDVVLSTRVEGEAVVLEAARPIRLRR